MTTKKKVCCQHGCGDVGMWANVQRSMVVVVLTLDDCHMCWKGRKTGKRSHGVLRGGFADLTHTQKWHVCQTYNNTSKDDFWAEMKPNNTSKEDFWAEIRGWCVWLVGRLLWWYFLYFCRSQVTTVQLESSRWGVLWYHRYCQYKINQDSMIVWYHTHTHTHGGMDEVGWRETPSMGVRDIFLKKTPYIII